MTYEMLERGEAAGAVPTSVLDAHNYEAGSGRALSVPRRRSLVPPWVVGAAVTVLLPLAVAAAIFAPWFWFGVQPQRDLIDRMEPADCAVVGHLVVDTKPVAGNMMLLYLAGLRVHFQPDGGDRLSAVALPRLMRDQAWMGADVLADYFARHPVNGTSRCYYDRDASRLLRRALCRGYRRRPVPLLLILPFSFCSTSSPLLLAFPLAVWRHMQFFCAPTTERRMTKRGGVLV
jgi:hypothetical protein